MKTIKILGIFLFQKLKEVCLILIWKQNWQTPDSVILWIRTLVYGPGVVLFYYLWVKLTWYVLGLFNDPPVKAVDYWIIPAGALILCVALVALASVAYRIYLSSVITDFKAWFSSNWEEAKRKVEEKKPNQ